MGNHETFGQLLLNQNGVKREASPFNHQKIYIFLGKEGDLGLIRSKKSKSLDFGKFHAKIYRSNH